MMKKQRRSDFTLYETLIAMVMIAVIIPVALNALRTAGGAESHTERKLNAVRVATNYINELIVTDDWQTAETDGDFGDEYTGLRWEMETNEWEDVADTVLILTMTVFYESGGKEYPVEINVPVKGSIE